METETLIDDLLQWFLALATADEDVLQGLAEEKGSSDMFKFFTVLIPLLEHPNTDIGNDVVAILHELFYDDEAYNSSLVFCLSRIAIHCLQESNMLALFYVHLNNLKALDKRADADDYQATYQIMQIVESLLEMNNFLGDATFTVVLYSKLEKSLLLAFFAVFMGQEPKLVAEKSLAAFVPPADYANRLFATEVTATLFQFTAMAVSSEDKQVASAAVSLWKHATESVSIVESVLVALSPYHNRDPTDSDEQEYLFNLFDILGALLLNYSLARQSFISETCQGFELMLLMLKELNVARIRAIQLVDYALAAGEESVASKFMKVGGIKLLAPILMGKGSAKLLKSYPKLLKSPDQDETHACAILASLFKFIPKDSPDLFRLLAKFAENDGEKFKRLVELHGKYEEKVSLFDKAHGDNVDATDTEWILDRMNAGLFTLQAIDTCLIMLVHFANFWDSISREEIEEELLAAVRQEAAVQFIMEPKISEQVHKSIKFMLLHSKDDAPFMEIIRQFSG